MLRGEYQCSLQPTAWPMLSKQRPGNVSWLIQTCCQPRLTQWVLSGAGKGNVTEGMRDDRHPGTGTAGWQVCVCIYVCVCVCVGWRGASGNWWLYSPQMAGGEVSQTRSKGQSERTIHSWCSRLPDENVTMKKRRTKMFLLCCTNRVTNYGHFHNWNKQMIWHWSDQNEVRVYFPKTFSLLLHPLHRPKAASFFNGPVNILVFQ